VESNFSHGSPMAEASRSLRLVPPWEGAGSDLQVYACPSFDHARRAIQAVAASAGSEFAFTGFHERSETWLDTRDALLLGAGLVLRVILGGPFATARLTQAEGDEGPIEGEGLLEQTLPLGPMDTAARSSGPVGDRVRAVAGVRALDRTVALVTRRHVFEGGQAASGVKIVVDETSVRRPSATGRALTCRLTVAGDPAVVEAVATVLRSLCDLAPAPPFIPTILDLAGMERPGGVDFGPETLGPGTAVAELAYVSLRRNARAFFRNEPGTRLGDDPEALHDMRVAGRRMRAAFGLFAPYLPKRAEGLRAELGRLGRLLGAVRDLDVQLERLVSWRRRGDASSRESFDVIEAAVVGRRRMARRRLLKALDTARYGRFVDRLAVFLRRGPGRRPAVGRVAARAKSGELVGRRYRAVRNAGDPLTRDAAPAAFHALRIRAKRLRYALEFYLSLYDGEVKAMIESLAALQDLLGEHQDACVAAGHLESLAAGGRRGLSPKALFLMGSLAARYDRRARALRRAVPKAYRRIRGKRWNALQKTLARGTPS
jgi:CHAD domain-containing protein